MKKTMLCLLFVSLVFAEDLVKLKNDSVRLANQIRVKTDSLGIIRDKVTILKKQIHILELNKRYTEGAIINAICKSEGNILSDSNAYSEILTKVQKNDTIVLRMYVEEIYRKRSQIWRNRTWISYFGNDSE